MTTIDPADKYVKAYADGQLNDLEVSALPDGVRLVRRTGRDGKRLPDVRIRADGSEAEAAVQSEWHGSGCGR